MNTSDQPTDQPAGQPTDQPAGQPTGPDPASETKAGDPALPTPDESLSEMVTRSASESAGETTADFGPRWKDNLVAYLDGELNEQDMQDLDEVLVQHPDARTNVEELRQTWALLDVLPRPVVTQEFSAQTLATIHVVRDEASEPPLPWPRRGLLALAWALLLSASGATGVLLADRWQPDPTDKLIAQLSVVERLEAYREIGNLEFIETLADTGRFPRNNEFAEPTAKNSILLQTIPEKKRDRWTYIADLPSDRRKRLTKNREDFEALGAPRQQELNQLDAEITQSPDLANVAADFYDWLRTLRPWQRDAIRKVTSGTADKITLILQYLDEQEQQLAVRSLGGPQVAATIGKGPSLSSEEFARVITTIEERLPPMQMQQLATEAAALRGTARALIVLELSTSAAVNPVRPRTRPPRPQGRLRPRWPGPMLARAIADSINSESVSSWLSEAGGAEARRIRLGLIVVRGLVHESLREIRRNRPSDRDLQEHWVGLPREEQDELMRLPPSESKRRLRRSLYQASNPNATVNPLQLYARYFRLLSRIRVRRGAGSGSRDGPGRERPPREAPAEPPPGPPPATRPPGGTR